MKTKLAMVAAMLAMSTMAVNVEAKNCLKGAVVGGVAGHVAGKHGVAGAAAGCAIGHHMAKKAERRRNAEIAAANSQATQPVARKHWWSRKPA